MCGREGDWKENHYTKPGNSRHEGWWVGWVGKGVGEYVLYIFVFRILPVHYSTAYYLNRL